MEFPHLRGCAPTAPSLDPAPVQAQSFQREWKGKWKANPKGMATTWYLHRQGTHIHTNIPNNGTTRTKPLLCVSTKGLLETAQSVSNTQVTAPWWHFHQGRSASPMHPFPPSGFTRIHQTHVISPKAAEGHGTTPALLPEVPAPLSPSTRCWEGVKSGTEGQHGRGSGGSSGPGAALAPTLQQLSLHSGAATDSNNEMAALSTTLNKCHTLFLV